MKVLIVRTGAMGDVLHALHAVAALRVARPEWQIGWVVDPRWAPLLVDAEGNGPIVSRVHLAETKLWSKAPASVATMRSVLDLRHALRREHYDIVVDMQGTLRSAVIGWMTGVRQFAGYSDPRESLAAKFYKRKLKRLGKHVIEQGAALVGEACGIALEPAPVDLPRDTSADLWASEFAGGRQICVLAAGGGWGAKRWPAENFGALARELREMGLDVVVNASRKEDALAAKVISASADTARMAVCNVAGLIALMRHAKLLVGGDSGPTHLAAAIGVPLIALFGPTDPARNGPWGPAAKIVLRDPLSVTSHKRVAVADPGLANITVKAVVEAIGSLILRE